MDSFWDFFWLLIWGFFFVYFLMILFQIIGDLFRDRDLSGWAKALWIIALVFIPFLSALIYLVVRGRGMAERNAAAFRSATSLNRVLHQGRRVDWQCGGTDRHSQGTARPGHDHHDRIRATQGKGPRLTHRGRGGCDPVCATAGGMVHTTRVFPRSHVLGGASALGGPTTASAET